MLKESRPMRLTQTPVFMAILLASGLTIVNARGQDRIVAPVDLNAASNLPMQRIGPDDLLLMHVYDAPEFTRSVRVATDGTIRIPMIKTPLRVQGLYPSEVEVLLAEALQRDKLLVDPFVTVNVSEYHSRPISVAGAVKTPITFQAIGSLTLLEALTRAGGLSDSAGPEIIVTRPNGGGGAQSVQRIPVKPLIEGADAELNLKLSGGEEIRIPQVGTIVVAGSVNKPGIYPVLDPITNNTITTAIAQAGGLAQFAEHEAFIFRVDDQGVTHTIPVPLWDIIRRKKPDMTLRAKDVLQVPDSSKRRITQTTIQTLSGVGAAATSGVIIRR